jgi:hypothetical protein
VVLAASGEAGSSDLEVVQLERHHLHPEPDPGAESREGDALMRRVDFARVARACVIPAVVIAACGGGGHEVRPPWASAQPHADPPQEIWLFADSQLNNAAGTRTRSRIGALDNYAEHAIRPPSVDLWSEHLLAAAADHIRKAVRPAFFLGDAANTSCVGEMRRFLHAVADLPWFGVLGNHDGYYMGNLTFAADAFDSATDFTWQGACEHAAPQPAASAARLAALETRLLGQRHSNAEQGTMTKAVAIWLFLDDLHRRVSLSRDPLEPGSWSVDGSYQVYDARGQYALNGHSLAVRAIAAVGAKDTRGDTYSRSWQGYLLQDVELPGGDHAILLDTSDYALRPPSGIGSRLAAVTVDEHSLPGRWGRIGEHQARKAAELQSSHPSARFFLMGHHHWARLDGTAVLKSLMSDSQFATYISGHTHAPTAPTGTSAKEQWELNVGSLTDWPMQIARVAYWGGRSYVDMRVRTVPVVATPGVCIYSTEESAEMDYGTVDKYVARSLTIYQRILSYAISTHHVADAPDQLTQIRSATAPGVSDAGRRDALSKAIEYDRTVLQGYPDIVRVETDCAVWASNLEGKKNGARVRPGEEIGAAGAELRIRTNPFRRIGAAPATAASP